MGSGASNAKARTATRVVQVVPCNEGVSGPESSRHPPDVAATGASSGEGKSAPSGAAAAADAQLTGSRAVSDAMAAAVLPRPEVKPEDLGDAAPVPQSIEAAPPRVPAEEDLKFLVPLVGPSSSKKIPDEKITASSYWPPGWYHGEGQMWRSRLDNDNETCWCSGSEEKQYLQWELGTLALLHCVQTKGRAVKCKQWVTAYRISYTVDGTSWTQHPQLFQGNKDQNTVQSQLLEPPVLVKAVRLQPVSWHNGICMRAELLGCEDIAAWHREITGRYRRQKESFELEWQTRLGAVRAAHGIFSQNSGISAKYIIDIFPQEARDATGKENPTFHEICSVLATGPTGKGAEKICPRDGRKGCSIVDAVDPEHQGLATDFVSWCWRYSLADFVSSICGYIETSGRDPATIFLWVCFFCNNQYRILDQKSTTGADQLKNVFESRLLSCGNVLIMLDDFSKPTYIGRLWCVFETYVSLTKELPMTFILPSRSTEQFERLLDGGGIKMVKKNYNTLDVRNASASVQEDANMIKSLIESTIGFDAVNRTVKKFLAKWVMSQFTKFMEGEPSESSSDSQP